MSELIAVGGDVFAGAFTQGVMKAGFKVNVHLEHGQFGVKTAKLNFPHLDIRIGVDNWRPETLKRVSLMYANPPCAPWSSASHGRASAWDVDPRLDCIHTLMNAGLVIKPKAWIWESVTQAWSKGRVFVDEVAKTWMKNGYSVTILIQNNMYLGAPQNRRRMLFIAHKHPLVYPAITKPQTLREVLKPFQKLKSKHPGRKAEGMNLFLWEKSIKHAGYFAAARKYMTEAECKKYGYRLHSFLTKRYRLDEVCPVFFPASVWHPTEPRNFHYEEMLALSGLPKTWELENYGLGPIACLLSRTVLAPVGTWIATAVKDGLTKRPLTKPTYQLVELLKGTLTTTPLDI